MEHMISPTKFPSLLQGEQVRDRLHDAQNPWVPARVATQLAGILWGQSAASRAERHVANDVSNRFRQFVNVLGWRSKNKEGQSLSTAFPNTGEPRQKQAESGNRVSLLSLSFFWRRHTSPRRAVTVGDARLSKFVISQKFRVAIAHNKRLNYARQPTHCCLAQCPSRANSCLLSRSSSQSLNQPTLSPGQHEGKAPIHLSSQVSPQPLVATGKEEAPASPSTPHHISRHSITAQNRSQSLNPAITRCQGAARSGDQEYSSLQPHSRWNAKGGVCLATRNEKQGHRLVSLSVEGVGEEACRESSSGFNRRISEGLLGVASRRPGHQPASSPIGGPVEEVRREPRPWRHRVQRVLGGLLGAKVDEQGREPTFLGVEGPGDGLRKGPRPWFFQTQRVPLTTKVDEPGHRSSSLGLRRSRACALALPNSESSRGLLRHKKKRTGAPSQLLKARDSPKKEALRELKARHPTEPVGMNFPPQPVQRGSSGGYSSDERLARWPQILHELKQCPGRQHTRVMRAG